MVMCALGSNPSTVFLLLLLLPLFPCSTPMTFSFTTFQFDNPNITFQGDASAGNGAIQLTNGKPWSAGRAVFSRPVRLWDASTEVVTDFSTEFKFGIKADSGNVGDGIAFFLVPNGSTMPHNSAGGYLGLLDNSTNAAASTSAPVVAVEFDTKSDEWDPPYPHVALDVGSIRSLPATISNWSAGQSSTGSLRSFHVWVTFNSSVKSLTVVTVEVSGGGSTLSVSALSMLHRPMDLQTTLPEWVNVGFSAATSDDVESHGIYSWEFQSTLKTGEEEQTTVPGPAPGPNSNARGGGKMQPAGDLKTKVIVERPLVLVMIVVAAAAVVIVVGLLTACLIIRQRRDVVRRRKKGRPPPAEMSRGFEDMELREFSYSELQQATDNFNEERRLGSGAFGTVYLGLCGGSHRAIKSFEGQGRMKKFFMDEVRTIAHLSHKNLVPLVGWCNANSRQFFIVYDYMPHRSLDLHLFGDPHTGQMAYPLLPWEKRYTVVLGLASALRYLHEDWKDCVVHRDIKSANVMLDADFNARLGDFGLARHFEHGMSMDSTELGGTPAYMAPEVRRCKLKHNIKSDVYSFGVVALEVATGRKTSVLPTDIEADGGQYQELVAWVRRRCTEGDLLGAADERLRGDYNEEQMRCLLRVGLLCTVHGPAQRPSMSQVMEYLTFKAAAADIVAFGSE